jgi:hypothetical protein
MTKTKSRITGTKTVTTFIKGRACSDTLFHVISDAYEHPMKSEEKAVMPLAGGIMQHGYQCGMIWGATLAAGAQAYRLFGPGPQAETRAIIAAQKVVESFRADQNTINCLEITDLDRSSSNWEMIVYFLLKGGTIGCFRMAARYAPVAFKAINTALSEASVEVPSPPVSCAAMLAQKLGVSDMHEVMAAGFAGGIGLSGGACGALGAAIWIFGMNRIMKENGKIDYKDPKALEVIDKFLKCTDYKFECSDIVGRKFENVEDHAAYLRTGGCSEIIEALAAE